MHLQIHTHSEVYADIYMCFYKSNRVFFKLHVNTLVHFLTFSCNLLTDYPHFRVETADYMWVFLPRKRDWASGSTLTGSPGVLARVGSARGREWLREAVPPLYSLSTDYEAGPRRVPLGTPQATHSLLLLCYRICHWGDSTEVWTGVCVEDMLRILNRYILVSSVVSLSSFVLVTDLCKTQYIIFNDLCGTWFKYFRFYLSIPQKSQHV